MASFPHRLPGFGIVAIASSLLLADTAHSQSFTRILDPTNPVVTDAYESGGGAWVDVDDDGDLDLFVAHGNLSNQDNALYLNQGGGQFTKVMTGAIVHDGGSSIGSTWADYDADGHLDCFVTNRNNFGNFLYRGTGGGQFVRVTGVPPATDIGNSNSSSWVDLDRDGVLDLFVVNFSGTDFAYRGLGAPGYGFARLDTLSITVGPEASIPGAWADYDNDGDADLFVGNAGLQNDYLYTNNGAGHFTRRVLMDGLPTLGASWGDFDNDGDLDLFVANYQSQHARFYVNSGPPTWALTSVNKGAVTGDFAWAVGSAWGDIDNDGDLDLFVAHDGENSALYRNDGPPSFDFTKITTGDIVNTVGQSFGCVWGDYDGDGDLDLFVANRLNQVDFLYRNETPGGNWITVQCVGTATNRSGIGTHVRAVATIGGQRVRQLQEVSAQTGYNSQNLWLHFGLGDATDVDSLLIEWPSGTRDVHTHVVVNHHFAAWEGGDLVPTAVSEDGDPDGRIMFDTGPNPSRRARSMRYRLDTAGHVSLRVYDVRGTLVASLVDGVQTAGLHEASLDRDDLPAGTYLLRLETPSGTSTRKSTLLN